MIERERGGELSVTANERAAGHRYFETGLTSLSVSQSVGVDRSERVRSPNVSRSDYSADSLSLSLSLSPHIYVNSKVGNWNRTNLELNRHL